MLWCTPQPHMQVPGASLRWLSWGHRAPYQRPRVGTQSSRAQLISSGGATSSRRQTLTLLGASPVWCCAACNRNSFLDRSFALSMATGMAEYEQAIAPFKQRLFHQLAEGALQPAAASGRAAEVLELGIGTGPNLAFYGANSSSSSGQILNVHITGVDPNPYMLPHLQDAAAQLGWPDDRLTWVEGQAEALPLPDASVDAVVCTLVLCSVPDVPAVLREVKRVLRPGGAFLFIEHTIAGQDRFLLQLGQRAFNPLQQLLADGCRLTRDPLPVIEAAGFPGGIDATRFEVEGMALIAPHVAGIGWA